MVWLTEVLFNVWTKTSYFGYVDKKKIQNSQPCDLIPVFLLVFAVFFAELGKLKPNNTSSSSDVKTH